MKKRTVLLTAIMVMLFCVTVRAADSPSFSCAYVPKSENSSMFTVEVSCDDKVSAAVFSLSYDEAIAEYKGVEAVQNTSTIRDNPAPGKVNVCVADSGSVEGKLCRLRFKALAEGKMTFTLCVEQAADSNARLISGVRGDTLTVDPGQRRSASSGGSSRSRSASPSRSSSSRLPSGSSTLATDNEDRYEIEPRVSRGGTFDVRPSQPWRYILIGAGAVALVVILIAIGVRIGRKLPEKSDEKPSLEDPESPDEPQSNTPDLTPEEKQALINELNQEINP